RAWASAPLIRPPMILSCPPSIVESPPESQEGRPPAVACARRLEPARARATLATATPTPFSLDGSYIGRTPRTRSTESDATPGRSEQLVEEQGPGLPEIDHHQHLHGDPGRPQGELHGRDRVVRAGRHLAG